MELIRGMRDKLSKSINTSSDMIIDMSVAGPAVYDFCCFGVDSAGKLSDNRYMIFYNQISSPNGEISFQSDNNAAKFNLTLSKLPDPVVKLIFTVSIDGNGTMGEILKHNFSLSQNGIPQFTMNLTGSDFKQEKAIISVELYWKGEWRISATANGFNGRLSTLLSAYGGTETQSPSSAAQSEPAPSPVDTPSKPELQPISKTPSNQKVSLKKTEEQLTQEMLGKINLSKDKVTQNIYLCFREFFAFS